MARELFELPDGTAVCCNPGGRWHGWLFVRHPDGQFVSARKLEPPKNPYGALSEWVPDNAALNIHDRDEPRALELRDERGWAVKDAILIGMPNPFDENGELEGCGMSEQRAVENQSIRETVRTKLKEATGYEWPKLVNEIVNAIRAPDETAWLIELTGTQHGIPEYYGQTPDGLDWTKSHLAAVRFARREDAEAVIGNFGWTEARAIERTHMVRGGAKAMTEDTSWIDHPANLRANALLLQAIAEQCRLSATEVERLREVGSEPEVNPTPENSIDFQQQHGVAWDIIAEALEDYRQFMLDDDYDYQRALTSIMERMSARREAYLAALPEDAPRTLETRAPFRTVQQQESAMDATSTQGTAVEFKPRPKQITPLFLKLMDELRGWRGEDHQDARVLHRNEIIEIIEGVDALNEKCGNAT